MRYTAPAVQRTVRVLGTLAEVGAPATLAELARTLALSKSSLLGILTSLEAVDWVRRQPPRGGYTLGPAVLSTLAPEPQDRELSTAATPVMEHLARRRGETVLLGTESSAAIVVREIVEGGEALRVSSRRGARLPVAESACGKAYLAGLREAQAERYVRRLQGFPRRSPADGAKLLAEVAVARERGYAVDDEQSLRGVWAVAVPVCSGTRPPAVLWLAGLVSTMPLQALETVARDLVQAAAAVVERLDGGRAPG